MSAPIQLLVQGAKTIDDVPNLHTILDHAHIRFATDRDSLKEHLPGAEIMFGWDFRADDLEACWQHANSLTNSLNWIHWGGAGVDAALFPGLKNSDVMLTNSRGVFDRPMAEWALGMMIAHAKRLPETLDYQRNQEWNYRQSTLMSGQHVLIVGVGSIGREIGYVCKAFGMNVSGIGRSTRAGDDVFETIYAQSDMHTHLGKADYVVLITPLTADTENIFDESAFSAMKSSGYFINLGRGPLVDETAMLDALNSEQIAGAALDVFREEPMKPDNPVWHAKNTIVSPHMSGDHYEHQKDLSRIFLENFNRYRQELPLDNLVDKKAGFVPSG